MVTPYIQFNSKGSPKENTHVSFKMEEEHCGHINATGNYIIILLISKFLKGIKHANIIRNNKLDN